MSEFAPRESAHTTIAPPAPSPTSRDWFCAPVVGETRTPPTGQPGASVPLPVRRCTYTPYVPVWPSVQLTYMPPAPSLIVPPTDEPNCMGERVTGEYAS